MQARVLVIAGSDSSGEAGIQADIRVISHLGGHAATAITALTAQNTKQVSAILPVPGIFVKQQIDMTLSDIGVDIIKIGMLHNADVAEYVITSISENQNIPVIYDPVMVSTSGRNLLDISETLPIIKKHLIPKLSLITPNIPEAEKLINANINNTKDMQNAANKIISLGADAVLIKGGHSNSDIVCDVLHTRNGIQKIYHNKRIIGPNTRGTGCTLASAIACKLAQGHDIEGATTQARNYIYNIIKSNTDKAHTVADV